MNHSGGLQLPIPPQDIDFASEVALAEVADHRAEIVKVWKEEMPHRTPVVSFDYTWDPKGVMRIGEDCLANPPPTLRGPPGFDIPAFFRAEWEAETSKEFHDEHAVICVFLPYGLIVQPHWIYIPIDPAYTEGTVVERLIQTVENFERGGQEFGVEP
jgi:hypothetical protein